MRRTAVSSPLSSAQMTPDPLISPFFLQQATGYQAQAASPPLRERADSLQLPPSGRATLPPSPGGIRLLTRKYPVSQSLALLPLLGTNHLTPIIATSLEVVALSCSTSQSLHNLSFIAQNHSHEVVEYLVRSMRKKLVCSAQGRLVLKILLLPLEGDYPLMIRTG